MQLIEHLIVMMKESNAGYIAAPIGDYTVIVASEENAKAMLNAVKEDEDETN